ncbi:Sodium:dicarboxylate symporter [Microdochium trichocladiopsis]|uniref:Amino acid transporter n=1 Tax=Microdochium trichocladiopsis TaxID=1682393 RepID=A0A9P9BL14_9PEZI|nr:Sodium:dicarboxylate symporter [Microdochium trichocladiopsis]KAH7024429.1 Sodium:dicarboxylate symporter [Microdochium trichocladiopsis]
MAAGEAAPAKKTFLQSVLTWGSPWQIVGAAVLAIAIGMAVTATVDSVPQAAIDILGIPGDLWLRALKAVVLPLIVTSMILAMQRLKEITAGGNALARWTIGYYVLTTVLAIVISTIMTSLVWANQFQTVSQESLDVDEATEAQLDKQQTYTVSQSIVNLFQSFVTDNFIKSLANMDLLAVLVASVVIGYLLKPGTGIVRAVHEIEAMVTVIITFLIYLAPLGVFHLILPNMFKLDLAEMGENLGYLIAGSLSGMFIQLFIVIPIIYFAFMRQNPYTHWLKCSPAWITAWGSASSAATLPVTMKCALERGTPRTVAKFAIPLGCLINMDGTAIYFPVVVTFLAETQGITLSPTQYVFVVLLSTLASIGATPIPSSSLVLTVMIAESINVPLTGMYAVVVAIDWFLDRFRTAVNVSGDLFAAPIITKMTGLKDADDSSSEEGDSIHERQGGPVQQTGGESVPEAQLRPTANDDRV